MHKKTITIVIVVILLAAASYWATSRFSLFENNKFIDSVSKTISKPATDYSIEEVARGLMVPWSMVFTAADRILVTERYGAVRVIEKGQLAPIPLASFPEASTDSEEGLMGMAIAPSYSQTKHVFVCITYKTTQGLKNKIMRFEDRGTEISNSQVIFDDIPAAQFHAGCRLLITPDEKLFITTGDATDQNLAQDKNSLAGKILRLNLDGTIPQDNPFPKSPIWTFGHRNPQGLAWDNVHNVLWSSEHGPSTFDGPAGGDEINLIEKGKNYGWPIVSHKETKDGLVSPLITFTPALAPASLLYYNNDTLPFFKNNLFFGGLVGEGLYHLKLNDDIRTKPELQKLKESSFGRVRNVVESPDGLIYFSTSNTDGRGKAQDGDDKIYRIVPKK